MTKEWDSSHFKAIRHTMTQKCKPKLKISKINRMYC